MQISSQNHEVHSFISWDVMGEAKIFFLIVFEKYRIIQDKLFQSDFDKYNADNLLDFD